MAVCTVEIYILPKDVSIRARLIIITDLASFPSGLGFFSTEDETYKGLACKRVPAWFVNVAPYAGGRSTSFCDLATPRPKVFYCPGAKHTLTGSRESSYGYPWKQATEAPWVNSWHRRGKVTRLKRPSQKIWLTESQTAEWFNSSLISNFNSLHAGGKRTMICYQDGRAGGAIKAYVFAKSTTFFGSYFK